MPSMLQWQRHLHWRLPGHLPEISVVVVFWSSTIRMVHATTIDFREKAPLAASRDMFLDDNGALIKEGNHLGIRTVGVPGTVAGLYLAHQKYGKLPWAEVVDPAVKLARNGFSYTWTLYFHAKYFLENYSETYPELAGLMLNEGGNLIKPGQLWVQHDLADALERIRDNGKDGFYKGKTAQLLIDYMQKNEGLIAQEDLDRYEAIERMPVKGTFREYEIYSMPPPSSGGLVLLSMLNMLEQFNESRFAFWICCLFPHPGGSHAEGLCATS